MVNRREISGTGAVTSGGISRGVARAPHQGEFSGSPAVELLNGRNMKLLKEFSYKDPSGKVWKVPEGYVSDGASIPRVLWSAVGGPLDGAYRDAALIHDFYCDIMERPWEATHRVFFDGMITRGLTSSEATKKYWAVFYFGPRWDDTHRWTGMMQLNKRLRTQGPDHGGTVIEESVGGSAALPVETAATVLAQEQQFEAELREFERAARQIDESGLGPSDVPGLQPRML